MKDTFPNSERGNVLFYILIAVALLAALSYAVSQGNRSTGKIGDEQARLYASEILEYSNVVASTVGQLRLRGCDTDEISFENDIESGYTNSNAPTDESCDVFSISGGAMSWISPPEDAMDSAESPDYLWHIYGDNEIDEVGTTTGAAASSDLVLFVDELSQSVCQQINGLLGVTDTSATPPTDTDIGETKFTGSYSYTATIGDEAGGAALSRGTAGCFENTTDTEYVFYKVLISR